MNLTAIVKTFRRDAYLRECLKSLKTQYPKIEVIVVDDCGDEHNREFVESMGGVFLTLPFDSGLPAGRNFALEHVKTDYVLIGDDDFFYETKDVEKLLALMPIAGIAGGRVIERNVVGNYQCNFREEGTGLVWQPLPLNVEPNIFQGVPFINCDLIFNFFVARVDVLRGINGWDANIMVAYEHSDFFINAKKQGVRVAYCPDAFVTHKPEHVQMTEEEKTDYQQFRSRKEDRDYFLAKWGYSFYRDANGHEDKPELNMFQIKARKAFLEAERTLGFLDVKHWLEAGTCLGVVRDNNFIGHDSDIDFGVFGDEKSNDIRESMEIMGFKFERERGAKGNGLEQTFRHPNGIKVDVFYFYETGDTWWHSAWKDSDDGKEVTQLFFDFPKRLFQDLKRVSFMGQCNVPLPNPPEEYLACRYGDWKTPKKEWDWANDPLCRRR